MPTSWNAPPPGTLFWVSHSQTVSVLKLIGGSYRDISNCIVSIINLWLTTSIKEGEGFDDRVDWESLGINSTSLRRALYLSLCYQSPSNIEVRIFLIRCFLWLRSVSCDRVMNWENSWSLRCWHSESLSINANSRCRGQPSNSSERHSSHARPMVCFVRSTLPVSNSARSF